MSGDNKKEKLVELTKSLEEDADEIKESFDRHKQEGYYVFISFDLVNSTIYKLKNKKNWPSLFDMFYSYLEKEMKEEFGDIVHVWKYVGDEVLFFIKIINEKMLLTLCTKVNKVQNTVTTQLQSGISSLSEDNLNIKTTVWSADIKILKNQLENVTTSSLSENQNILIIKTSLRGTTFDFLGPSIDIGFRISEFSEKNQIVVGAELAHLLYENRGAYETEHEKGGFRIENNFKIVSYEKLKGVWNERRYPIIWYNENWNDKESLFEYDEKYNSRLVSKIVANNFDLGDVSDLKKIYKDLGRLDEFKSILNNFKEDNYSRPFKENEIAKSVAEIHCVCICINSEKSILIAKRANRVNDNQKWEFGCGQIPIGADFNSFIKKVYSQDFGLDIETIKRNEELIPVATYTLKRDSEKVKPGIIFVGKVKDSGISVKENENYSDAKFVSLQELNCMEDVDMVNLMKENAKLALDIFTENNLT